MYRGSFVCVILALSSPSWAQDLVESILEIPYQRLQAIAQNTVDFEARSEWTATPKALNRVVVENGVEIAATFKGQTVSAQRTDTNATNPLALTPLTPFTDSDIRAAFNEPDGFRTLRNYTRRSAYLPLVIGGRGRRTANMLTGHTTEITNKAITSLSPRLQLQNSGGWTDNSVIGIEPIALLFDQDQTAVGFTLIALQRYRQTPFVGTTGYGSLVQIKFFRRDGTLISEVVLKLNQTAQVAFARCGETVDIAGVQISNSSRTGFALDNIIFNLPKRKPSSADNGLLPRSNTLSMPSNPLDVEVCSLFTS